MVKDTGNLLNDLTNCKERHLKIQRDRLVDEFAAALTAFQSVQRKFVDLEKHAVRQAYENKNIAINKPPPGSKGSSGSGGGSSSFSVDPFEDSFVTNKGQTQAQMQDDMDLQALEEQERSIRELEENIVSVNEIYKKLGALVYEQGNTVDSIEASVEQTSVFVQEGAEQLRKAGQYRVNLVFFKSLIGTYMQQFSSFFSEQSQTKESNVGVNCNSHCRNLVYDHLYQPLKKCRHLLWQEISRMLEHHDNLLC